MKFSIITATYNSEKTINKCLESILNQDYNNIEIIIVDGNSQDNTSNIIQNYKKSFDNIIFINEKDDGIYDALNKGINRASGDIIGFVHSDDFLAHLNIISEIYCVMHKGVYDGIYGDLMYVSKKNTDKVIRYWKSCQFNDSLINDGWMPAHPTLFLKKEVYDKHGLFDLSYKISSDYDFMLRILKDKSLNFFYLQKVITIMRLGGISNGGLNNLIKKTYEDYKAIRNNDVGGFFTLLKKNISKLKQFFGEKS